MIGSERLKLRYGPYLPPNCGVGDKLPCECRGREVTVVAMSDAPIQWPCARGQGPRAPILCGDLIRAVRLEFASAVAHHWGVHSQTVTNWRWALKVPRMTLESVRRRLNNARRARDLRAKIRASKVGPPPRRDMIDAQRKGVRGPKSDEWKREHSKAMKEVWAHPEEYGLPPSHRWTEEEIALLGTMSDAAVARRLGLRARNVECKRRRLGIPSRHRPWTETQIALLGTASDRGVGRELGKSASTVRVKRQQMGIPPYGSRRPKDEIALIGTASDCAVARGLGRSASAVQSKREQPGVPPFAPRWTEEEISWLGVDSDRAIAEALGRSEKAVRSYRTRRGIPAWRDE